MPVFLNSHKINGFSLTELLVVVAIVSLFSALSVSMFNGPQDSMRFKQEIAAVQDVLLTARDAAMAKSECVFVTVTGPQTMTINAYAIASPCIAVLPPPNLTVVHNFNSTTTISNFNIGNTLVFRPSGGTTTPAPVTLNVDTSLGQHNMFTIYSAIGQVRHL